MNRIRLMIEIIKAIILGVVQGLTEFLPVSSSGHLIFVQKLGVGSPSVTFNIMLHLGTLFSALIALRKPIINTFKDINEIMYILIASVPTFIIAAIFKCFFEDLLEGAILGIGFLITAVFLVLTEALRHKRDLPLNSSKAFFTGIMQGIAVLPGVSRSGMTISILRGMGIDGKRAAEFSFLIAIPVILGGAILEILSFTSGGEWSILAIILGVISAFISGFFAIRFMIIIFSRKSLLPFAVYVVILSIVSFLIL